MKIGRIYKSFLYSRSMVHQRRCFSKQYIDSHPENPMKNNAFNFNEVIYPFL